MPKRKHNKAYYISSARKKIKTGPQPLTAGVKGILITTGDQGKFCVPEAYNLLNEYADHLYGPEVGVAQYNSPSSSESEDGKESGEGDWKRRGQEEVGLAQSLEEEVAALKRLRTEKKRRFSAMDTGAKHLVFIKCSDEVEPAQLVHTILEDAYNTKIKKSRYCQRLLPVSCVCRANLTDLCEKTEAVLLPYFHQNYIDTHTYCVQFKSRNSDLLQREVVLRMVADLITQEDEYPHRANLKNPEFMVDINVIGGLCCIGVMTDYFKFRKYNLRTLTTPTLDTPTQDTPIATATAEMPSQQHAEDDILSGKGSSAVLEAVPESSKDCPSDPCDRVPELDPNSPQDSNSVPAANSNTSPASASGIQMFSTVQTTSQSSSDDNSSQKQEPTDWASTGSRFSIPPTQAAETLITPLQSAHTETRDTLTVEHHTSGSVSPPPHQLCSPPSISTSSLTQTTDTVHPNSSPPGAEDQNLPCSNDTNSNGEEVEHKDCHKISAPIQNSTDE